MASITPTNQIDAAAMAANWGPGVSNNAQKWKNKTLKPRQLFNADPAANELSYANGVNRALSMHLYSQKIQAVDLIAMANGIDTYGTANYLNSGTTKAAKYKAKTVALAAAETAVLQIILAMPKGRGAPNEARMVAWKRGMEAYNGKI